MVSEELAVFGGPKTVTLGAKPWPCFSDEEIEAVKEDLIRSRSDWREACTAVGGGTSGELETRFAAMLGREHAIATAGGGPALHIACLAAGVGLGDEVITTPYSWGQTVSCILQAGGIPIFADLDPESLTIDPATVEPLITERTKAIVVCDIFGSPADMDALMAIAKQHNLIVIEDCAQAQGSLYRGTQVGTRGHFGCFSIGSGKNLAAGDGGILVCDDRRLYELALLAGMHPGRNSKEIEIPELKEQVDSLIYTYRINAFTAALALKQMDRVDDLNSQRRANINALAKALEPMPGIRDQRLPDYCDPCWHMKVWTFVPEEVPGVSRKQYCKALQAEGVPLSDGYVRTPIHLRYIFRNKDWWLGNGYPWAATEHGRELVYAKGDCPVAEQRCDELDLHLGGGAWYGDLSELVGQVEAAFAKVTAAPERLRKVEA